MKLYADRPERRRRQVIADALTCVWVVVWIWAGFRVHAQIEGSAAGARRLESGSGSVAQHLSDAGSAVAKIPFVGSGAEKPFKQAAQASGQLQSAGKDIAVNLDRMAWGLGIAVAVLPLVIAAICWWLSRGRYARTAGVAAALAQLPGGEDLLALRAMTELTPSAVTAIDAAPAAAWRADDRSVIRALAHAYLAMLALDRVTVSPEPDPVE